MEINTEINKVFGREMAALFAANISEEELKSKCEEAWQEITERPYRYGNHERSILDKLISEEITKRVMIKVDEILKTPIPDEQIQKEANEIAEEAKKRAHEMMVNTIARNISNGMFNDYSDSYAIQNGCDKIVQAIMSTR